MSQSAALPLDPGPGLPPVDGTVHGPGCYDGNGELTCGWPERHDESFTGLAPSPPDQPVTKARSKSFLINLLTTALTVALGAVAVGIGILVFVAHAHFQTVTSGSMRPTISPGDVAVTQAVPVSSLKVGDIIVFYPPGVTAEPVMHRIVSIDNGLIKTRGDANNVEDPWQVTLRGTTAYRMVAVVPFLGWLIELQRPALIVAGLLLGLALLLEIRKEVRGRKTRARSEPQT
jgi:signal peptidase I